MLYSLTMDIESFFLTKNKKKRKKNIEETYDVVYDGRTKTRSRGAQS
jgi:hypothetical protein